MTSFKKIFETDDLYEECASCNEGILASEAFKENGEYYHADCVQMHKCIQCGSWIENGKACPEDGEVE